MATIRYEITAGEVPFKVELFKGAELVQTEDKASTGEYHFTNLPDGYYTIVISDNMACYIEFSVDIDCFTTTYTTLEPTTDSPTTLEPTTDESTTIDDSTMFECNLTFDILEVDFSS